MKEVAAGTDCGLTITRHNDFQVGDEIECFSVAYEARQIVLENTR